MEIHRKKVLVKIMLFAIFIAVLHYISLKFYLYWTTPIDILMHILGGVLIGLMSLYAIYFLPPLRHIINSQKKAFLVSVVATFVVGFLWEIFELKFGLISYSFIDRIDSIKDMFDDIIGALLAGWYFIRKTLE
jgi:hypothetical protein